MAISQAGIVFRVSESIVDTERFMTSVFGEPASEIPLPVHERFDIRNHSDVMVQVFGDVCFISNDDLAWPLIRDAGRSAMRLHAALGAPELLMAFCHYDRGGSHGYALFDKGRRVRTRLQTSRIPDVPVLQESGAPLPFEQRWMARRRDAFATAGAEEGHSVPPDEREVTATLLRDGLEALFGVCPWETLMTPSYRFFRLGPERTGVGEPARPAAAIKRAWWQRL
jgi:hypothetical protein